MSPTNPNSVILASTLESALAGGDVIVQTGTSGTELGNITVGAPLSWSAGSTLTLDTYSNATSGTTGDIIIAQPITATNGGLTLDAYGSISTPTAWADASGMDHGGGNGAINVGTFDIYGGDWRQVGPSLPGFSAGDFYVDPFGGSFLRASGGSGTAGDPYILTDLYGLQGVAFGSAVNQSFALGNDIDASATANWSYGFNSIGATGDGTNAYTGTFDGRGHAITGMTQNSYTGFGLFALTNGATIRDLTLNNVDISGGGYSVGALIAEAQNTAVTRVRAQGQITSSSSTGTYNGYIGGLIGSMDSTSTLNYATSDVFISTDNQAAAVGGLVGLNQGTISYASASGSIDVNVPAGTAVSGTQIVGGLVGDNSGAISKTYATGPVTVTDMQSATILQGGLAGRNRGSIDQSYATGLVRIINFSQGATSYRGGLVGENDVNVTNSFFDSTSTQQGSAGLTTAQFQDMAGFMKTATAKGWNFITDWAPPSAGYYPELYSISPVLWYVPDDQTLTYGDTFTGSSTVHGVEQYVFGTPTTLPINYQTVGPSDGGQFLDAGTYAVSVNSGLLAAAVSSTPYRIVSSTGTLTVNPAPLTITADNQSKLNGFELDLGTTAFTTSGLFAGDTVSSVYLSSEGAPASADPAGSPYPIYASEASGTGLTNADGAPNYEITYLPGYLTFVSNTDGGTNPPPPTTTTPGLPNPPDNPGPVIDGLGGSGASGGEGGGSATQIQIAGAEQTLATMNNLATDLKLAAANCNRTGKQESVLACVSDALQKYATALDSANLKLPPELKGVSASIERARAGVDAALAKARRRLATATTPEERAAIQRDAIDEARNSVRSAEQDIRKQISLIRADDPKLARLHVQQGNTVLAALDSVDVELSRAVGL